jgi:hypothetical protein
MSQQVQYIQLEANEDVPSVRDRLSFIRGKRILLIWPETGTALTRKLDLVFIQREAKRRVLQIALVTHDKQVMQHARDLGISTFETIGASRRARWKRGRSRVFVQRYHRPNDNPEPHDLMPVVSRVRVPRKPMSLLRYAASRGLILLLLALTLAGLAYVVLPTATVTLPLSRQFLRVNAEITTDPNIADVDVENGVIPATRLRATVETSSSIPTTGRVDLEDLPASGSATFTNQTNRSIEIAEGTVVSTSAGTPILFRTTESVILPPGIGERAEIPIEALPSSSGEPGNVAQGQINTLVGPLADDVSVRNLAALSGGDSRSVAAVTQADRDQLRMMVAGLLQQSAYDEMQLNLLASQTIVVPTIYIAEQRNDWTTFSHEVGDVTDTLSLRMRAIVEAVAIDDRFTRQIVFARLSAQRPEGYILLTDSLRYERGAVGRNSAGYTSFTAFGEVQAISQLDRVALQGRIVGQRPEDASALLAREVILASGAQPQIQLDPEWLPTMPLLSMRIQIVTE